MEKETLLKAEWLTKEMKKEKDDEIVAVDLSKANHEKGIVGEAITDSVKRETWDYIYNRGVEDTNYKWREAVLRLKEESCRCHLVCLTNVKCDSCQRIDEIFGEKLCKKQL